MESIFSDMMTRARASIPSIKIEFSVIEDYVIGCYMSSTYVYII